MTLTSLVGSKYKNRERQKKTEKKLCAFLL